MNGVFATLGILSPVLLVGALYLFWPLLPILLAAGLIWWATTWPPEVWKGAAAVAGFGVAAFVGLACGPVLLLDLCLAGGAVLLHRAGREWEQVRIALLILAASIAPHAIFLLAYDHVAGAAAALPAVLRRYEELAVWLHQHLEPLIKLEWRLGILLSLLAVAYMVMRRDAAPVRRLGAFRIWSGRALLVILGVSSFTVFTSVAPQDWTPDTRSRLRASLRSEREQRVQRYLAVVQRKAIERDPSAYVRQLVATAALVRQQQNANPRYSVLDPVERRALSGELVGEATDQAVERVVSRLPEPQPADGEDGASTVSSPEPSLADARTEERRAASAAEQAVAARAELKKAAAKTIGKAAEAALEAAGVGGGAPLLRKLSDLFLDKLYEKLAERGLAAVIDPRGGDFAAAAARLRAMGDAIAKDVGSEPAKSEPQTPLQDDDGRLQRTVAEAVEAHDASRVQASRPPVFGRREGIEHLRAR